MMVTCGFAPSHHRIGRQPLNLSIAHRSPLSGRNLRRRTTPPMPTAPSGPWPDPPRRWFLSSPSDSLPYPSIHPPERIRQLIADLDDDSFSRREAATRELSTSGIQAELLLGECLSTTPSPEVCRRVNSLLENLKPVKTWIVTDASLLRTLRAIRVLQRIGNPGMVQNPPFSGSTRGR